MMALSLVSLCVTALANSKVILWIIFGCDQVRTSPLALRFCESCVMGTKIEVLRVESVLVLAGVGVRSNIRWSGWCERGDGEQQR